ncbi:MAG: SsrA-binding protein SmpB [Kiritimatiellaeota bacterium]|nr:SsrA-binding protein SmpB [Kiritimatiellota bacterium]
MDKPSHDGRKILTQNRKARHDYAILDSLEAGIALVGTEVKVLRENKGSLIGSYAAVDKSGQVLLYNANIPTYTFGNRFNHDPVRPRKLLVHRAQIRKLKTQVEQKGNTLIPLSLYLSRGKVKVELAVCKGKAAADKRETIKRRDADLSARRAIARAGRR